MSGRPQSNTVAYFSHDTHASHGRTLSILYNSFGHEGISTWWQLLEELASTENQVITINGNENLEYLASKIRLPAERLKQILQKMADLDAIDRELFQQNIIWCNNLVMRLQPTYQKRKRSVPEKPIPATETPISVPKTPIPVTESGISGTKVKESKGSKVKEVKIPDFVDEELWADFLEMRKKLRKPATARAQDLLLRDLERLRAAGDDPNEVIRRSIKSSWPAFYPLKGDRNGAYQQKSYGKIPKEYSDDQWGRKPEDPNYGRNPD